MPDREAVVSDVKYGIATLDLADGYRITAVSEGFTGITGYTQADISAQRITFLDITHPDDRGALLPRMEKRLAARGTAHCDHRVLTKDQRPLNVLCFADARDDGPGNPITVVIMDISDIKTIKENTNKLLNSLPCGVARYQALDGGRIELTQANSAFFNIIDISPERFLTELDGQPASLLPEEEWKRIYQAGRRALKTPGEREPFACSIRRGDGVRYLMGSVSGVVEQDGSAYLLCILQDITALQRAREALLLQTERFNLVANATNEHLVDYDARKDRMVLTARKGHPEEFETVTEGYLAGLTQRDTVHPDDSPGMLALFDNLLRAPTRGSIDFRSKIFGTHMPWSRAHYASVADATGKVTRIVGRIMDITEEKERELALKERAERDALTDLYNRRATEMLISDYLAQESASGRPGVHALMMIDLDDFKLINDHFSHAFGDAVLSEIAGIIHKEFRDGDIVGRIGGDEFLALAKDMETMDSLDRLARRICAMVDRRFQAAGGKEIRLSVSIGVALYPKHGDTLKALFHGADIANYQAKANGKNGYSVYAGNDSIRYVSRQIEPANLELFMRPRGESLERALLKALREGGDRQSAVYAALELIAGHFAMQRAYITVFAEDGSAMTGLYSWCTPEYPYATQMFRNVNREMLDAYYAKHDGTGVLYCPTLEALDPPVREALQKTGVHSTLQYKYVEAGMLLGIVGFEECAQNQREMSAEEQKELVDAARVLALYVLQKQTAPADSAMVMDALLGCLPSEAYMADPETHTLLFLNEAMKTRYPLAETGGPCFRELFGRSSPCGACPMRRLDKEDANARGAAEVLSERDNRWLKVYASWARWRKARDVCFLNAVDVTEYKR